ncbi:MULTISPECIES: DUF6747 family protein [Cellulophaga]|uniref:DUF6747 family protein n=1 Tax=Cellulophaga TaxID=104264 RepID=UPI00339D4E39
MGKILHLRNLYLEAFENCKPAFLVVLLKLYSLFSMAMISMALYAFLYRAVNGFKF